MKSDVERPILFPVMATTYLFSEVVLQGNRTNELVKTIDHATGGFVCNNLSSAAGAGSAAGFIMYYALKTNFKPSRLIEATLFSSLGLFITEAFQARGPGRSFDHVDMIGGLMCIGLMAWAFHRENKDAFPKPRPASA